MLRWRVGSWEGHGAAHLRAAGWACPAGPWANKARALGRCVPVPQGKGCGFVQFVLRTAAEQAMTAMNGQVGDALRWARWAVGLAEPHFWGEKGKL